MKRTYPKRVPATLLLRSALKVGFLVKSGRHWKFGSRLFHSITVLELIEGGEAVRIGDHVVAWRPA